MKKRRRQNLIKWTFIILSVLFSIFTAYKLFTGFATSSLCTDSDGGKNYFIKGTVTLGANSLTDSCISNSSYNLKEIYCLSDITAATLGYLCPQGCNEGACINISSTHSESFSIDVSSSNPTTEDFDVSNPSETSEFQGYIIELRGEPLVVKENQITASNPTFSRSVVVSNLQTAENNLQTEKNTFKQNALSILGKTSIVTGSAVSNTELQVWEEYDKTFNGFALNVTAEEAEKIKTISGVKSVTPNHKIYLTLNQNINSLDANDAWKLDSDRNPCATSGKSCLTGKGIRIGIIDTGVDYTHPDLGGCFGTGCKVAGGWDFNAGLGGIIQDSNPMDENGHGTHVASIAAGNGVLKGVAPDAIIYAYKVMGPAGYQYTSSIIAAIERSVDPNKDGDMSDHLDIISLSLGGKGNPDDILSRAVDRAVDAGVVVVVSAGNDGPEPNTIGSPGTARQAITVGANYNGYDNRITNFSSRGPVTWNGKSLIKPDINAPGARICAAKSSKLSPETIEASSPCLDDKHISLSGTSMAVPFVSGTAALLKQEHPDWTPAKIKMALVSAEYRTYISRFNVKYYNYHDPNEYGYGRLNVLEAVENPFSCSSAGELCFLTQDCCNPSACVNRSCTYTNKTFNNSIIYSPPVVTCKSLSGTCVIDSLRQSNCCNELRCAEPEFFNPSKGKCIACISPGKMPPNQKGGKLSNLCCSGNWKWIWNWFKSGYYCI